MVPGLSFFHPITPTKEFPPLMAENLTLSRPGAQNLGSDPAKMFRDVFTGEVLTPSTNTTS